MALPESGKISLNDIIGEFEGPGNLTAYYRGGDYVPDTPTNNKIPTSGTIKITDFYGSSSDGGGSTLEPITFLGSSGGSSSFGDIDVNISSAPDGAFMLAFILTASEGFTYTNSDWTTIKSRSRFNKDLKLCYSRKQSGVNSVTFQRELSAGNIAARITIYYFDGVHSTSPVIRIIDQASDTGVRVYPISNASISEEASALIPYTAWSDSTWSGVMSGFTYSCTTPGPFPKNTSIVGYLDSIRRMGFMVGAFQDDYGTFAEDDTFTSISFSHPVGYEANWFGGLLELRNKGTD